MATRNFLFITIVIFVTSCVSNKKVTLLQKNDLHNHNTTYDSLMRTHDIENVHYRVQPEDLLSITIESLTPEEFDVFNRPSSNSRMNLGGGQGNMLLMGELVDLDGYVPFILAGKVKVAGLTIYEIQDTLQSIANESLKLPLVRVRLLNYRMTVLGEVFKEGAVPITNNRISIIEAIGLAGGLGELADRENIKLIRQVNGKAEIYYVNLLDEDFIRSPLFYVHQNDVLIVPPLRQRPFRRYFGQNFSLVLSSVSLILLVINLTR